MLHSEHNKTMVISYQSCYNICTLITRQNTLVAAPGFNISTFYKWNQQNLKSVNLLKSMKYIPIPPFLETGNL